MSEKQILKILAQYSADQITTLGLIYDLWKADQARHEHAEKCMAMLIKLTKDQSTEGRQELETLEEIVRGLALDRATMRRFDSVITHARHQATAKNAEIAAMLNDLPDE